MDITELISILALASIPTIILVAVFLEIRSYRRQPVKPADFWHGAGTIDGVKHSLIFSGEAPPALAGISWHRIVWHRLKPGDVECDLVRILPNGEPGDA